MSGHHLEAVVSFTPAYDYEMFTADRMLDILTGNDHQVFIRLSGIAFHRMTIKIFHQKTCDYFREEENLKSSPATDPGGKSIGTGDVKVEPDPATSDKEEVDFETLKTLENEGIDVSFLENMKVNFSWSSVRRSKSSRPSRCFRKRTTTENPSPRRRTTSPKQPPC